MTDFLYAQPSWIDGVMSLVDIMGVSIDYNFQKNGDEADRKAFRADMKALQNDFITTYEQAVKKCQIK